MNQVALIELEGDQITSGLSFMDFYLGFEDDGGNTPASSIISNANIGVDQELYEL